MDPSKPHFAKLQYHTVLTFVILLAVQTQTQRENSKNRAFNIAITSSQLNIVPFQRFDLAIPNKNKTFQ